MDFKVIFKASFIQDLERIVRRIGLDDSRAAQRLGDRIVQTAASLTFFPERYPRVRQRPRVRRFIVGKHFKVFYRVKLESKTVEILRCWDGRQGAALPEW